MLLKTTILVQIVLLAVCHCEGANVYISRIANRRQKKLIEGAMDLKADPCNDFFQYACGNWQQVHLDAGVKYYEPISMLDYNVNQEMAQVFNRLRAFKEPKFIQQADIYYKSCKNLLQYKSIKYLSWLKLNDNFKWPALWTTPKNNTQFDWVKMLAKMRTYGFNDVFIQQIIMSKVSDTKTYIIDLDKPVANEGFVALTENNLRILMESLPAQIPAKDFENLWQEIEAFEQKLSELDAIEDVEVENELEYEKFRLFSVEKLPLNWLRDYLKIILNQTNLDGQMQVYLQNIPYMKALDELLAQYSQRFLCKYLEIRFMWYLHIDGPANFMDKDCLSSTRSLMPLAMHWQYEQLHPDLLAEYSTIYALFNDIRKHFNATVLSNKHGFAADVVNFLQNKLNHMQLRLNNVPRLNTVETLERFYDSLNLDADNFYGNHLQLLRFHFLARLDILRNRSPLPDVTYLENGETGSSSSPYFVQNTNTVFVPLTLLQPPIYTPGLADIYKYSSLGFLLAHEMFHGFDDSGLLTDANGSLKLIQFDENPLFNASMNCLLELNPNVIGEKIADISGLRYAYQAFLATSPAAATSTVYLHGNEVSPAQVFFLNFAQFFCGKLSEEFVSVTEHGSDHERVTDALSHFPEFSREFKCNKNHRLYPHEVCRLWR